MTNQNWMLSLAAIALLFAKLKARIAHFLSTGLKTSDAFRAYGYGMTFICLFSLLAEDSFTQEVPCPGLIGHWSLDSSVVNQSPNALDNTDLILIGEPSYTKGNIGFKTNGALYFYGKDIAKLRTSLPTSQFSLSLWFNTNDSKGGTIAGFNEGGYGIRLKDNGRLLAYASVSGSFNVYEYFGTENLADGKWHHVVLTYNGYTFKVYVDNVVHQSSGQSSTLQKIYYGSDKCMVLGGIPNDKQTMFTGSLDEVL